MELSGSAYDLLPQTARTAKKNLKLKSLDTTEEQQFLSTFLRNLVPKKRSEDVDSLLKYKIHHLSNPEVQKNKKYYQQTIKAKSLPSRQRRKLLLAGLKEEQKSYNNFIPLHELWLDYMRDLLRLPNVSPTQEAEIEQKLLRADYHGCKIKVTQSKCDSLLGHSGIIFQETKNTWRIITETNQVKVIPKNNTVVTTDIDGLSFSIYGTNFQFRSSERSSRRYKGHLNVDPSFVNL